MATNNIKNNSLSLNGGGQILVTQWLGRRQDAVLSVMSPRPLKGGQQRTDSNISLLIDYQLEGGNF